MKTQSSPRSFFRRTDLVWVFLIAGISLFLFYYCAPKHSGAYVAIYHENECLGTYSLSKDQTFSPEGFPTVVFQIKDGSIAFISSDCPDQTCVRTGFLSRTGGYAVCLPHRLTLKIIDGESPDGMTR